MDKQSEFKLGMTVHDRHDPSPSDAVIVNLPDIPISEFTAYHDGDKEVTVAEDNPGYDPQQRVVVVVYQDVLDNFGGKYRGSSPISFDALSRNNIPYYGFPPERLVPDDLRYNTNPPESVGASLISDNDFINREELELAMIDRVTNSGKRIAKTASGNEINVGPAPADPGESTYILPLSDSNSSDKADHDSFLNDLSTDNTNDFNSSDKADYGLCLINLSTDNISDFSVTEYIKTIVSLSQSSTVELEEQLSCVVDFKRSGSLVELFESVLRPSESRDSEEEPQTVRSSECASETNDSNAHDKKGQNERAAQNNKHSKSDTQSEKTSSEKGLEELRSEAKNSGSENPSKVERKNTPGQTKEYNRSPKVREYVKRRAGGTCEGCGEPAPFTSKTGSPYLHAHHIHELGDGGVDTIDSVIALCPNCHYRVHHGQDGDEYNQQLLEIVRELEDVE